MLPERIEKDYDYDGPTYYVFNGFKMWTPFDEVEKIVENYGMLCPEDGASECQYDAFCDWLKLLNNKIYKGEQGVDIQSLVDMLDHDLKTYANISGEIYAD